MVEKQRNWAGNYEYSTGHILYPRTVEEVQEAVKGSARMRGLGSRHSFNHVADSSETLISLAQMQRLIHIDAQNQTVTVDGGITYGQLCDTLHLKGYALHNLASLPHISVVGSCMTGTHGSGRNNGNLATIVPALEFVTADGTLVQRSMDHDGNEFPGMVVALGGMGIVTKITLKIMPRFDMRQDVYLNMPFSQVENYFDDIQAGGYSVSLFTRWQDDLFEQVWLKNVVDDSGTKTMPDLFFGATRAETPFTPLGDTEFERCTEQLGVQGPWHERLPHFRMNFTPSHGEELQAEYFVPYEQAVDALNAVKTLKAEIAPLLYISEIRTIAADNLWMSPCYRQACVAIHFTWKPNWGEVSQLLPKIEAVLEPFQARPHWGKLFTMAPERIQSLYEKLPDFRQLLHQYDPQGKFRNEFMNSFIHS